MKKGFLLLILASCIYTSSAYAIEIGGVTLPDTMKIEASELILNGAGLRKKVIIKVYACGLYLTEKNKNAASIIAADDPMMIRMHFIYKEVSSDKLIDTWNEGFNNATGGETAPIINGIKQFNSYFTDSAKKGDIYDIIYNPDQGTTLKINDKIIGVIPSLPFKKALFSIWLGDKPADTSLRQQLLGLQP